MKKIKHSNSIWPGMVLGLAIIILLFSRCTKMDNTYHDFWKEGERTYPASPDSLKVFSGENRIEIFWLIVGDRSVTKAMIYWNNKTDSLEVPIKHSVNQGVDTVDIVLDNMPEGNYSFNIYTFDNEGNRSVGANITGKVYGDSYTNSLLTRIVNNASFIDDTLRIQWGDPADATSIGANLIYTDITGAVRERLIAPDADTTVISDFNLNNSHYFKYSTLFLPDSTAIDTFATAYDSVRVLGPRADLPKDSWTVAASSYDSRNGRTDRTPEMTIDNNTSTAWINLVGSTDYPHTITIDMGEIKDNLYGVSLYFTSRNETPQSVDVYISDNGTDWQLMGLFPVAKATGWLYIDFSQPQSFRYFRIKGEIGYGSANIVLYEIGAFTR